MSETFGRDLASVPFWEQEAETYKEQVASSRAAYHDARLATASRLIESAGLAPARRIVDFGCGDGSFAAQLVRTGCIVHGVDIAKEMVRLAREAVPEATFVAADARALAEQGSCDGLTSLNVLAYLTEAEHEAFWDGARRIVGPGGWLLVSHSNELFDLFALNAGTDSFFQHHLTDGRSVAELLTQSGQDNPSYNVRANPLSYGDELSRRGFREVGRAFFNYHPLPPAMLGAGDAGRVLDPDAIAAIPTWKQMLQCSTYFSLALRDGD
jgi:2-polyprenyl-3-methyl-5-hydroxy-6-metoxy-1,4-benzoquinol methylase